MTTEQDRPQITEDFTVAQLKEILTDPELWVAAGGYGRDPSDYDQLFIKLMKDSAMKIFLDFDFGRPVGFIIFKQGRDDGAWSSHVGYKETYRGKRAVEAGKQAVARMFADGAHKLIAAVPENNQRALEYTRLCGFEHTGYLAQAVKREGITVGVHFFERAR